MDSISKVDGAAPSNQETGEYRRYTDDDNFDKPTGINKYKVDGVHAHVVAPGVSANDGDFDQPFFSFPSDEGHRQSRSRLWRLLDFIIVLSL